LLSLKPLVRHKHGDIISISSWDGVSVWWIKATRSNGSKRGDHSGLFRFRCYQKRADKLYGGKIEIDYCYQELNNLPLGYSCPTERKKPWGTAHAVWVAKECVTEPFAVINADDYYGPQAFMTAQQFLFNKGNDSTVYHGGVNRGVVKYESGLLKDVHEVLKIQRQEGGEISGVDDDSVAHTLTDDTLVSMNFFLFTPSLFGYLDSFLGEFFSTRLTEEKSESYIPAVVDSLIKGGQAICAVEQSADQWFGVTYPEDKPIVIRMKTIGIEKIS